MFKFYDLYSSFEEFYESFFRGNEITFHFEQEDYYIFPLFNDSKKVYAVMVGKAYDDNETVCFSKAELLNWKIGGFYFHDILERIDITFYNF